MLKYNPNHFKVIPIPELILSSGIEDNYYHKGIGHIQENCDPYEYRCVEDYRDK